MKNIFSTMWSGIITPFKTNKYITLSVAVFVTMFIFFILIPVFTVAGNTITAQLAIFTVRDYVVITLLSGLYALFMTMHIYARRQRKGAGGTGTTVGGGLGALFAGVAGTAFCASCLAPLFALFGVGFGGVLFVLQYRFYFVVGISILMLIAIYLTARKIQNVCTTC